MGAEHTAEAAVLHVDDICVYPRVFTGVGDFAVREWFLGNGLAGLTVHRSFLSDRFER